METLKYTKVREVKSPVRAHSMDAGIDFFVPTNLTQNDMASKYATSNCIPDAEVDENGYIKSWELKPGESILIPSGIKVKVPDGYMLQYHNKSGIASKRGLMIGANTVDIGYQGECHLNIYNVSNHNAIISAGDKIAQGIMIKIGFHIPEEVENEHALYGDIVSERSINGFGSTGSR